MLIVYYKLSVALVMCDCVVMWTRVTLTDELHSESIPLSTVCDVLYLLSAKITDCLSYGLWNGDIKLVIHDAVLQRQCHKWRKNDALISVGKHIKRKVVLGLCVPEHISSS